MLGFLTSLKTKLLSLPVIFVGSLIAIISMFLIYNSDTILSKFGFETKTALKAQVVSLKKDLERVEEINKRLNEQNKLLEKSKKEEINKLTDYYNEIINDNQKTCSIKLKKKEIEADIREKYKNKQVVGKASSDTDKKIASSSKNEENETITLNIDQLNKHSALQISSLNEVYHELFEKSNF